MIWEGIIESHFNRIMTHWVKIHKNNLIKKFPIVDIFGYSKSSVAQNYATLTRLSD